MTASDPSDLPDVPTVMIPNPEVHGDFDRFSPAELGHMAVAGAASVIAVKLGAVLLPPEQKRAVPRMEAALRLAGVAAAEPPPAHAWLDKAKPSINRMYANDRYGDCVIADVYHGIGVWTGYDTPACVVVSDQEVIDTYFKLSASPGRDVGCIPADVLEAWKRGRIPVNGQADTLRDYAALSHLNEPLVKNCVIGFGSLRLAIDLPTDWQRQPAVWSSLQNQSGMAGGHMITVLGWTEQGFVIGTWGGTRLITYPAWRSMNRNTELYATLSDRWTNEDRMTPWGIGADRLAKAIDAVRRGEVPSIDPDTPPQPPAPPPPPGPPVPPAPPKPADVAVMEKLAEVALKGPQSPADATWVFAVGKVLYAAKKAAPAVFRERCESAARPLAADPAALTPEQIQAIIQIVVLVLGFIRK